MFFGLNSRNLLFRSLYSLNEGLSIRFTCIADEFIDGGEEFLVPELEVGLGDEGNLCGFTLKFLSVKMLMILA